MKWNERASWNGAIVKQTKRRTHPREMEFPLSIQSPLEISSTRTSFRHFFRDCFPSVYSILPVCDNWRERIPSDIGDRKNKHCLDNRKGGWWRRHSGCLRSLLSGLPRIGERSSSRRSSFQGGQKERRQTPDDY